MDDEEDEPGAPGDDFNLGDGDDFEPVAPEDDAGLSCFVFDPKTSKLLIIRFTKFKKCSHNLQKYNWQDIKFQSFNKSYVGKIFLNSNKLFSKVNYWSTFRTEK